MRYIKVLVVILIFFLSMVFFFQNQAVLSTEMVLNLNLFFIPPMSSISLPFYFLVLAAFLLGAIVSMLALMWDKIQLSTKFMKSTWRVRALEKEVEKLKVAQGPQNPKTGFFGSKSKENSSPKTNQITSKEAEDYDDLTPPDPDRQF